jgi:hypothetical protein
MALNAKLSYIYIVQQQWVSIAFIPTKKDNSNIGKERIKQLMRVTVNKDMLGDDHIHIEKEDPIGDWLAGSIKAAKAGTIKIDIEDQPAVQIDVHKDMINVNLLQPAVFKIPEDETGLFDKLNTAKEFAQKLSDNGLTISFLRKSKKAIMLGKEAKPTLSKLITRSDDIQINSTKESAKLKSDLKAD